LTTLGAGCARDATVSAFRFHFDLPRLNWWHERRAIGDIIQ
jgi:hypothetical protein